MDVIKSTGKLDNNTLNAILVSMEISICSGSKSCWTLIGGVRKGSCGPEVQLECVIVSLFNNMNRLKHVLAHWNYIV